jgi:hypothetical protein
MRHSRVLAALLVLAALGADAAPRRTRKKPQPAATAPAAPAEKAAEKPAAASAPAESEPAPVQQRAAPVKAAAAAPAPAPVQARRASLPAPRVGLGLDLFGESGRMTGGQWINTSHRDESFDFSSQKFLSGSAWLLFSGTQRLRLGPGVRVFGNYAAGGDRTFTFGVLTEALALAEYGLPVHGPYEVVFGARTGLALLIPGGGLSDEIHRLRTEGAGVWNVPRGGWVVGLNVGGRRAMTERISLRADFGLQLEKLYLFGTDQRVDGLQFQKSWDTQTLRLGLTLGAEFSL